MAPNQTNRWAGPVLPSCRSADVKHPGYCEDGKGDICLKTSCRSIPPPAPRRHAHCPHGYKHFIEHVAALCSQSPSQCSDWLETVRNSSKPKTHTFIWRCVSINRGQRQSRSSTSNRLFSDTQTSRKDTAAMVPTPSPTAYGHPDFTKEHLTPAHKLRKPMVEKLRRDRINTCIEQLKSLLSPEFLRQQPDSKQEKADILEMAVSYLRNWQQQNQQAATSATMRTGNGYAHCVQEAVSFLSRCEVQTQAHRRLLGHFQNLQASSRSSRSPCSLSPPGSPAHQNSSKDLSQAGLWRPW
ncbi:hypothetical protein LDENG_00296200 [Lucifuga dentata]|nr:hypothetical protein LDENG_00296200 [Lucifuga dentata]